MKKNNTNKHKHGRQRDKGEKADIRIKMEGRETVRKEEKYKRTPFPDLLPSL